VTRETVVLTGAAGTLDGLARALVGAGFDVRESPLITFAPPTTWALVDQAIDQLAQYAAITLTSPRAATAFGERVVQRGRTGGSGPEVWAGGSTTAAAWPGRLGQPRVAGGGAEGEGAGERLAADVLGAGIAGPVLFPCGDRRRDELPDLLRKAGLTVTEVICYCTRLADEATAAAALVGASIAIVTSPSVAQLLCRARDESTRPKLVAIGTTTATTLERAGWPPVAIARAPTSAAILEAVWPHLRHLNAH
jgi:uroporphyrinogen-III synthase